MPQGVRARDYYSVLRVLSNASQMDIDRAYQKMVKESAYDNTISRKDIEQAYRTLADPTQRSLYDYSLREVKKKLETTAKHKKMVIRRQKVFEFLRYAVIALFLVVLALFGTRYGYQIKSFSAGDQLYTIGTDQIVGQIEEIQDGHDFGRVRETGCLVKLPNGNEIWYPLAGIKASCYKK